MFPMTEISAHTCPFFLHPRGGIHASLSNLGSFLLVREALYSISPLHGTSLFLLGLGNAHNGGMGAFIH